MDFVIFFQLYMNSSLKFAFTSNVGLMPSVESVLVLTTLV